MRSQAALMAVLSRPVTAQRARLYLRCFFTGTGQSALSSRSRLPPPSRSISFRTCDGADQVHAGSAVTAERPCRAGSHSLVSRQFFFGPEAAGAEIENLGVTGIKAERARWTARGAPAQSADRFPADIAMDKALQLLEGGGVGPEQGDPAAVRARGILRQILAFGVPFGMVGGGIVPIHQQRVDSRRRDNARPGRRNRPAR